MKKIFTILILGLILSNCVKNQYKKELLGNWNNFPIGGRTDITFYKDSIVSYEYSDHSRIGTWKADSNKIYIHFPKKIKGFRERLTLFYNMSINKDSLFTKLDTDTIGTNLVLFRVTDHWRHFLREFDLRIDLPEADFKMIKNDSMRFGINLYIGYQKEKLSIKSDSWNFNQKSNLENLTSLVFSERAMRNESEEKFMYFNLIIDKNISDKKIDSIKQILKIFPEMKHFRVYKNDSANYGKYVIENNGESWNWYGKYE